MKGIGDAFRDIYSLPKRLLAPLVAIFVGIENSKSEIFSESEKQSSCAHVKS
jgi:hypothetical protein